MEGERQPLLRLTKSNDPAIKHHLPQHWSLAYRWGIVGLLAFMAFTVYVSLRLGDYALTERLISGIGLSRVYPSCRLRVRSWRTSTTAATGRSQALFFW